MYSIAVKRDFTASHFLVGADWGPENSLHSHQYAVEALLEGDTLNRHGYLIDIVEVETALEALVGSYRDAILNNLEEFQGLNPSIEHFAHIFCQALHQRIQTRGMKAVTVKIWEGATAWASYRHEI